MATTYKGYKISKNKSDKHPGYVINTPNGTKWNEIAVNLGHARKWIEWDIFERRQKRMVTIEVLA
jgi:hypothetical protein